jgi:hypothetical protein
MVALCEEIPPELLDELDAPPRLIGRVVERADGAVVRFLGD